MDRQTERKIDTEIDTLTDRHLVMKSKLFILMSLYTPNKKYTRMHINPHLSSPLFLLPSQRPDHNRNFVLLELLIVRLGNIPALLEFFISHF